MSGSTVGALPSVRAAPQNLDLVFRCASADHEYSELTGLGQLREVAVESGATKPATPGGGSAVSMCPVEFVLVHGGAVEALAGLRTLVDIAAPASTAVHDERSSRTIHPGRLPSLSSKPSTPMQRQEIRGDERESTQCDGDLPPITVYESQRPASRQYTYKKKPTGEGLSRVLAFAAKVGSDAGASLPGLRFLHETVLCVKRKQPYRLVNFPARGVWREPVKLPRVAERSQHVDATRPDPLEATQIPASTKRGRVSTAKRIDQKLEDLAQQLQGLQKVRTLRQTHNARLGRTAPAAELKEAVAKPQAASVRERAIASPPKLSGTLQGTRRRNVGSPSVSSLGGTLTTRPPTVVEAVLASKTSKRPVAASPPTNPPPANRAPFVPHRGLRAASTAEKRIPATAGLSATLL